MRPLLLLATTAAAVVLAACGSTATAPPPPTPPGAAAPETSDDYVVRNYAFTPLTVAPEQTIRVVDGDDEPHTLTAEDGSFDTGPFDASKPGSFTSPATPGTYPFVCKVHPSMRGTLTVR